VAVGQVNPSSGEAQVGVNWSLDCPYPADYVPPGHVWGVQIAAMNSAGTVVTGNSADYGGGESANTYGADANPNDSAHGYNLALMLDPSGPPMQSFQIVVTLQCNGVATTVDTKTVVLTRCNPEAYDKAQREYDAAERLIESGSKDLEKAIESDGEVDQEARDEGASSVIQGEGLGELLTALEHGAVITPQSAAVVEAVHLAVELAGVAEQAVLRGQEWDRLTRGAEADFEQARRLSADANQLLAQAVAGGCHDSSHDQLNKLLDDQKREDMARQIVSTWESNQNETLVVNPVTHETESVDLAVKQVEAALSPGAKTDTAALLAQAGSGVITAEQVRAAIGYLDQARTLIMTLEGQLGGIKSDDESALRQFEAAFQ
jgi:hypothetical protein